MHFYAKLDTLNSKNSTGKAPNQGEYSSVPIKYTVAIYTAMPKTNLGMILVILEKYIFFNHVFIIFVVFLCYQ